MVKNPECSNCFEEISWTPVYSDGDAYCCDGCVMGGPCICTYKGPPPRLNIEDILAPENQSVKTECANCFEEFRRPPVSYNGRMYCCEGCAHGGPCICTYEVSQSKPDGGQAPGTSGRTSPLEKSPKVSPVKSKASKKANRLWKALTTASSSPNAGQDEGRGVLSLRASELELEPDFDDNRIYTKFQLTVSPLIEMVDVSLFTAQLESISAIENVTLTRFDGDRATFEVETMVVKDVVKGVMNVSHFRIQSLRMTPDGLDLLLKTTGADSDEEQPQDMVITLTANDSEEHDIHPVPRRRLAEQEAIARINDEGELHTFKFEMGVDVFFNGRHQVEIGGVKGPVHMHSWRVQAILVGESADEAGSIMGTSQVREVITAFVTPFNETLLNKMPPFDEIMPTANNMARVIYDHLAGELEGQAVRVKSIRLWESPTSYVEYSGTGSSAF